MTIRNELYQAAHRFVNGDWSLAELRRWRRTHIGRIANVRDREARAFYGTLAAVLAEHDIGHRDEASVRTALAKELASHEPSLELLIRGAGQASKTGRGAAEMTAVTRRVAISAPQAMERTGESFAGEIHVALTGMLVLPHDRRGLHWEDSDSLRAADGVAAGATPTVPTGPLVGAAA